jgi:hypothetical protein
MQKIPNLLLFVRRNHGQVVYFCMFSPIYTYYWGLMKLWRMCHLSICYRFVCFSMCDGLLVWCVGWNLKQKNMRMSLKRWCDMCKQFNEIIWSNWDNLEGGNNGFQNKFKPIKIFDTYNKYTWPRVKSLSRWDYFFQNIHNCVYINARYLT